MTARRNRSVDDLDRLSHNRAGEIEILDPVRGRCDSEHVSASLGKQMARHGNGGGLRLSGDAEKAREFTQDTFIRAFSRLSQFRGDAAFSTWLHRIMVTIVSNARRSEIRFGREVPLDEAHSIEDNAPAAEPDLKECIARAVQRLSDAYRTTLIMHDIEGYTHTEIAEVLGVAEGTCKSRLSQARAQLRAVLSDLAPELES